MKSFLNAGTFASSVKCRNRKVGCVQLWVELQSKISRTRDRLTNGLRCSLCTALCPSYLRLQGRVSCCRLLWCKNVATYGMEILHVAYLCGIKLCMVWCGRWCGLVKWFPEQVRRGMLMQSCIVTFRYILAFPNSPTSFGGMSSQSKLLQKSNSR